MKIKVGLIVAIMALYSAMRVGIAAAADPATQPAGGEGLVIEQRVSMQMGGGMMPPQTMVMKIKGGQARIDMGTAISTIIFADGSAAMLMHAGQVSMLIPASLMQKEAGAATRQSGGVSLKPTGQKQLINGYDADEYVMDQTVRGQPLKATIWVAAKYPDADRIMAVEKAFRESNKAGKLQAGGMQNLSALGAFKGVPVRTESIMPNGLKTTLELISAKFVPVDDSEFEIPAGYQQRSMPEPPQLGR